MIKGMTGFGSAQIQQSTAKGVLEIKTVNHRYLDVSYYLPVGFTSLENKIAQVINKYIERGRVTVALKINFKPQTTVSINKQTVAEYLKNAKILKREFGVSDAITFGDLIKLPGVVSARETETRPEDIWPAVEKSLILALKQLTVMRDREGKALSNDILTKTKEMMAQIKLIRKQEALLLKENRKKLTPEEFTMFQKSNDVHEEITRFTHYVVEINKLIRTGTSVGKRLDFIAQEMQRETNTLGSKLQDKIISSAVIALKSKIEKIREQAQNVE